MTRAVGVSRLADNTKYHEMMLYTQSWVRHSNLKIKVFRSFRGSQSVVLAANANDKQFANKTILDNHSLLQCGSECRWSAEWVRHLIDETHPKSSFGIYSAEPGSKRWSIVIFQDLSYFSRIQPVWCSLSFCYLQGSVMPFILRA